MKEKNNWQIVFLKAFMFFTPFLFGGYHVAVSAFLSVVLCVFLLMRTVMDEDKGKLQITLTTATLVLIPIAYLAVTLWAVDSGTAIYGFIKFLPVALTNTLCGKLLASTSKLLLLLLKCTLSVTGCRVVKVTNCTVLALWELKFVCTLHCLGVAD